MFWFMHVINTKKAGRRDLRLQSTFPPGEVKLLVFSPSRGFYFLSVLTSLFRNEAETKKTEISLNLGYEGLYRSWIRRDWAGQNPKYLECLLLQTSSDVSPLAVASDPWARDPQATYWGILVAYQPCNCPWQSILPHSSPLPPSCQPGPSDTQELAHHKTIPPTQPSFHQWLCAQESLFWPRNNSSHHTSVLWTVTKL